MSRMEKISDVLETWLQVKTSLSLEKKRLQGSYSCRVYVLAKKRNDYLDLQKKPKTISPKGPFSKTKIKIKPKKV